MNTLARGALSAAVLASALILAAAPSSAAPRTVANPPTLAPENEAVTKLVPAQAAVKDKKGRLLKAAKPATFIAIPPTSGPTYNLDVVYTQGHLYNPNTRASDPVRLRSYASEHATSGAPYVAPTIEATPGDTITLNLKNSLPAEDPSCDVTNMNIPHCFNTTNMHTHGLWISPSGNSDNVLLELAPDSKPNPFQYEFHIPADHPSGTFWYHPHNHGSTALQVSSGMVGALIIRGSRLPTPTRNGDIDTLLYNSNGTAFKERVLVFQQIQYACVDAQGRIKVHYKLDEHGNPIIDPVTGKYTVTDWYCDGGDTGSIEFYFDKTPPLPNPAGGPYGFGPGNWASSARFTSINGVVLPTFEARTGDIERWRMIHAGVRDTIIPQFFPVKAGKTLDLDNVKAEDQARIVAEDCDTTNALPYGVFADDGLTMSSIQYGTKAVLQPGYRADALVVFPKAGDYCVVNAQVSAASSVSRDAAATRLLGAVHVTGSSPIDNVQTWVMNALANRARTSMPPDVRAEIINDLAQGLRLTKFTPHPTITDLEVGQNRQYLTFNIQTVDGKSMFQVGSKPWTDVDQDLQPYQRDRMDRVLKLGTADQWELRSTLASHPFHIHVNPFQIVEILDPANKDVSAPGAIDDFGGQPPDPQYPGLKGQWKDTLWIKNFKGPYKIVVRTRYERYPGAFVLHCHILDHEDQGMMQNVEIEQGNGMTVGNPHGGMKPGEMKMDNNLP